MKSCRGLAILGRDYFRIALCDQGSVDGSLNSSGGSVLTHLTSQC